MMLDTLCSDLRTIKELTVHAGNFHPDDVFCGAIARIINKDVVIHRVFQAEKDLSDEEKGILMADIGGGRYDHHQKEVPLRYDGIRHCAVTRMWLIYGIPAIKSVKDCEDTEAVNVAGIIYDTLLKEIAIMDNGLGSADPSVYGIGQMIDDFIPSWDSDEDMDEAYMKAVLFSEKLLRRRVFQLLALESSRSIVNEAVRKMENGIVLLDRYTPWEATVTASEDAKIVIFPSKRGGVNLQLVPVEEGSFCTRIQVPDSWRGKRDSDASAEFTGMTFCHINGFLSAFDTLEHAKEAADYLIAYNQRG